MKLPILFFQTNEDHLRLSGVSDRSNRLGIRYYPMQTYAELLIEEAWFYSHNPLLGLAYLYDAPYSSDVPRLNTKKVLQTLLEETAGPKAMAVYHQAEAHNWNGPVPKVELVDPQKLGLLLGVLAGYYDFL